MSNSYSVRHFLTMSLETFVAKVINAVEDLVGGGELAYEPIPIRIDEASE